MSYATVEALRFLAACVASGALIGMVVATIKKLISE